MTRISLLALMAGIRRDIPPAEINFPIEICRGPRLDQWLDEHASATMGRPVRLAKRPPKVRIESGGVESLYVLVERGTINEHYERREAI